MRIRAEDGGRPVSALLCWAFGQWTVWLLMLSRLGGCCSFVAEPISIAPDRGTCRSLPVGARLASVGGVRHLVYLPL